MSQKTKDKRSYDCVLEYRVPKRDFPLQARLTP